MLLKREIPFVLSFSGWTLPVPNPAPILQHSRTTLSCPVLVHPSLLSSHTAVHSSFLSLGLFSHTRYLCSFPCTTPWQDFVLMPLSSSIITATFSNFYSHTHIPCSLLTHLISFLPLTPGPLTLQTEFLWGTHRPRHISPQVTF